MRDYAALLKEARETGYFVADVTAVPLTPAVFGKLLVAAWASKVGRSDFPRRDRIMDALLAAAPTAPDEVKRIMHVEERVTGAVVAEYTEYLASAQMDGLIKRYNPDYVRVAVEIDRNTGRDILESHISDRPHVRDWILGVISSLVNRQDGMELDDRSQVGIGRASA